jgi:hypothetical protein
MSERFSESSCLGKRRLYVICDVNGTEVSRLYSTLSAKDVAYLYITPAMVNTYGILYVNPCDEYI